MRERQPQTASEVRTITPEQMAESYDYAVLVPYGANLNDRTGDARMSFFSAFVTHTGAELYKAGKVKQLLLIGERTFDADPTKATTMQLMREGLRNSGIPEEAIIETEHAKNISTPNQIEAIAKFQRERGTGETPLLFIDWDYHDPRVKNHIAGIGVKNAVTIDALELLSFLHPFTVINGKETGFNKTVFDEIVKKELEKLAATETSVQTLWVRHISAIDTTGIITKVISSYMGGRFVDIRKNPLGPRQPHTSRPEIEIYTSTGKKRLQEVT